MITWQPEDLLGHARYCAYPHHPPGEWCTGHPSEPQTMHGEASAAWHADHPKEDPITNPKRFEEATNVLRTLAAQTDDDMLAIAYGKAARALDDVAAAEAADDEDEPEDEEPQPRRFDVEVCYKLFDKIRVEAVDEDEALDKAKEEADERIGSCRIQGLSYEGFETDTERAIEVQV